MKRLFITVSSIVSGSGGSSDNNNSNNNNSPYNNNNSNGALNNDGSAPLKSLRSRFGRSSRQTTPQTIDRVPIIINDAANLLSQILQDILSSDLNNESNFQRLLIVLEGENDLHGEVEEGSPIESESQAINLLLENMDHPKFVDLCNQINLASGLFQALRLLRMIELKRAKSGVQFLLEEENMHGKIGVTEKAVKNVCSIFEKLCSSTTTIEQIRQNLVKLLAFPLSPSPILGQHLQRESVKIIRAICKTGFTSQQIWFLHEVQAMMHIIRSLNELIGSPQLQMQQTSSSSFSLSSNAFSQSMSVEEEVVLKGRSAEEAGMWVEAIECIVDVLLASLHINSVLLTDFEEAKGFSLLMTVMRHTANERFLKILNVISMLIFNPNCKKDETNTIPFTHLANYLSEYMLEVVSWPVNSVWDYDPAVLFEISSIMAGNASYLIGREFIIQGFAYTVLKLFSMEPICCAQLEEQFHFLGVLILTIPSLEPPDVVTAIVTVINYVFQCVETSSTKLISALCAASAVLVHHALNDDAHLERRKLSLNNVELLFASMEAVSRSNSKYVLLFLNTGVLKLIARDSLEKLHQQLFRVNNNISINMNLIHQFQQRQALIPLDAHSLDTYQRIVQFITDLNALSPYAAEEIRNGGTILLLRRIVVAPEISADVTRVFLKLTEDMSQVDTTYLLESLVALYLLIREVKGCYEKIAVLFDSLWKILVRNEDWASFHVSEGGLETAFEVLQSMKNVFSSPLQDKASINMQENDHQQVKLQEMCFLSLQAISRYVSLLVFHASEGIEDAQYHARFAKYFLQTGVFYPISLYRVPALQMLMNFLHVFALEEGYIQSSVAEMVLSILSSMSQASLESFVTLLSAQVLRYSAVQRAFLVESGIPAALLKLCPLYQNKKLTNCGKDLLAFTKNLTQSYTSSRVLLAQIKAFVRPLITDTNAIYKQQQQHFFFHSSKYASLNPSSLLDEEASNQDDRHDSNNNAVNGDDTEGMISLEDIFDFKHLVLDASPIGDGPYFIIPVSNNQRKLLDSTSLGIFFSPATTLLPAGGMSLSLWFRIANLVEATPYSDETRVVPIISIESAEIGEELVIELNVDSKVLTVACNSDQGRKEEQLVFKHSMDVDITSWTHLAVVIRRTKKLIEANSLLFTMYMNGIQWPSVDAMSKGLAASNNHFFTHEQSGEIRIGYERMHSGTSEKYGYMIPPDLSIDVSSLCIFSDTLQGRHISTMYLRGVSYQGLHARRCKMTQEAALFANRALCIANHTSKNALLYLDRADLRNIYNVVDRHYEDHQYAIRDYDMTDVPQPLMIISATAAMKERVSFSMMKEPALKTKMSPIRYALYDVTKLENLLPIATLGAAGGKIDHMSFGMACESIGSVSTWLPMLFAPQFLTNNTTGQFNAEEWVQQVLACITSLSRQSVWAQSYLHTIGYRLLSFALYEQFKSMIFQPRQSLEAMFYGQVLRILLNASVDKVQHANRNSNLFASPANTTKNSPNNNIKETLLLAETSIIRYIALNQSLWNIHNRDHVLQVLTFLNQLVTDSKFGHLNAMRLTVVGTPRWTLYLCLTLALNSYAKHIRNNADNLEKSTKEEEMLSKVTVFAVADHREEKEDALLSPAMSLLQGMLATDMRMKDLELIAAILTSSFYSPVNNANSTAANTNGNNSGNSEETDDIYHDIIEEQSDETAPRSGEGDDNAPIVSHPFCTYIRQKSSIDHVDYRYLTPMEKLRVYLLRLLTRVYEDHLEELRRNSMPRASANINGMGNNNNSGNNTGINNNLNNNSSNNNNNNNNTSDLLQVQRFRECFHVQWFLTMLEASSDIATLSCVLRLLGLMLQKDAIFSYDFAQAKGIHVLGHVLKQRNQEIPIVLPLISILFRIPMQMTLYPCQVKSTQKVVQMLDLDECAGPILSEEFLSELTIPLLTIYYSALVQAAKLDVNKAPWARQSENVLLQTLIYAFENSMEFRKLLQHRLAMEIHVMAMLSCSNAYQEYGAKIFDGDSLDLYVQEDYLSENGTIAANKSANNNINNSLADEQDEEDENEAALSPLEELAQRQRKQAHRQFSVGKTSFTINLDEESHSTTLDETSSLFSFSPIDAQSTNKSGTSSRANNTLRVPEDQAILFTEDVGQSLRDLLRHIIYCGFSKEIDNSKVLLHLFISYSTVHFTRTCERNYQKWICDSVRRVLLDVLSQPLLDTHMILCFAKNIHSLTMLLKGFYLYDTTVFALLQATVEVLQMMHAMPNTSGIVLVNSSYGTDNKHQLVMKELVLNIRLLLVTALSYGGTSLLGGNSVQVSTYSHILYKGNKVERKVLLEFVRKKMDLIFLPLVDDSSEPLTSLSSRFLASTTASSTTNNVNNTNSIANMSGLSSLSGVTGGSSNTGNESDLTASNVTSGTRRLSTTSSAMVNNAMNNTYTSNLSSTITSTSGNNTNALQALLQGKNDRAKIAAVFWAFLLSHCYWILVDEDMCIHNTQTRSNHTTTASTAVNSNADVKKIRQEAALIVTYLITHRRKLVEVVAADNGSFSRQWRTNEDTLSTSGTGSTGADLFQDGMLRLISTHHHHYSTTMSSYAASSPPLSPTGSSNSTSMSMQQQYMSETIELTISDFFYWLHQHQEKCDRIFRALDSALFASHGMAMPISNLLQDMEDCHRLIVCLRRVKDDSAAIMDSAQHVNQVLLRSEQAYRLSDRLWRVWRQWLILEPIRDMSVGALLFKKMKTWVLSGNVWGSVADQEMFHVHRKQMQNNNKHNSIVKSKSLSNSNGCTSIASPNKRLDTNAHLTIMQSPVKLKIDNLAMTLSASTNAGASSPYHKIEIPNLHSFEQKTKQWNCNNTTIENSKKKTNLQIQHKADLFLQPYFMWRVNYREGPERTRRMLYQDFSKPTQELVHYNEELRYVLLLQLWQQQQQQINNTQQMREDTSAANNYDIENITQVDHLDLEVDDDHVHNNNEFIKHKLSGIREEDNSTKSTHNNNSSTNEEEVGIILRHLKMQGILRKQSARNLMVEDSGQLELEEEEEDTGNEDVNTTTANNASNLTHMSQMANAKLDSSLSKTIENDNLNSITHDSTGTNTNNQTNASDEDMLLEASHISIGNSEKLTTSLRGRLFSAEENFMTFSHSSESNQAGPMSGHNTANNSNNNSAKLTPHENKIVQEDAALQAERLAFLQAQEREAKRHVRSQMLKEMIRGLISSGELRTAKLYNIDRIFGLEAQPGVLFHCKDHWYVLLGMSFLPIKTNANITTTNLKSNNSSNNNKNITHFQSFADVQFTWRFTSSLHSSPDGVSTSAHMKEEPLWWHTISDQEWLQKVWQEFYEMDMPFVRFHIPEIYSFFHRRHQLKYTALEIADRHGLCLLFACQSVPASQELLTFLIDTEIPGCIYAKFLGMKNLTMLRGTTFKKAYPRLLHHFVSALTQLWQHHEISNFEYLLYLNAAAGRSYNDLTQYPVFPWVLQDYSSSELDLNNPETFRDLSKPMGALSEKRRLQYLERYTTMNEFYFTEEIEGASPPFHYGTHYSCAGYVLHYLLRLQPYTQMSLVLQGGTFDKADRLFYHLENSWLSASKENLQDVRELIPEFYYLPDFLVNKNGLQLGITQKNEVISDVVLPAWVPNQDAKEFIRLHRMALESKYVSEHLHEWVDLIFGVKQLGKKAIDAMNVFIHITYEGEVDLEAIDDDLAKTATLAQINNFGQTPSQLFTHKEHPKKVIPEIVKRMFSVENNNYNSNNNGMNNTGDSLVVFEPSAISAHAYLTPPLSVIGIPHYHLLTRVSYQQMVTQGYGPQQKGMCVGDVRFVSRDKVVSCGAGCVFVPPLCRRLVKFRTLLDGVVIQNLHSNVAARALDSEKDITFHEQLHVSRITVASFNRLGDLLATGAEDCSVRLWQIVRHQNDRVLENIASFNMGHTAAITCLDVCSEYHVVVSGSQDKHVGIWDYHAHVLIRMLPKHLGVPLAVSMNPISGSLVTLTKYQLRLYHSNGEIVSYVNFNQPAIHFNLPCNNRNVNNTNTNDSSNSNSYYSGTNSGMKLPFATAGCVVPCGDWQEANSVVCVTGHKEGYIHLWKLRSDVKALVEEVTQGSGKSTSSNKITATNANTSSKVYMHVNTSAASVMAAANRGDFSPVSCTSSNASSVASSAVSTPMNSQYGMFSPTVPAAATALTVSTSTSSAANTPLRPAFLLSNTTNNNTNNNSYNINASSNDFSLDSKSFFNQSFVHSSIESTTNNTNNTNSSTIHNSNNVEDKEVEEEEEEEEWKEHCQWFDEAFYPIPPTQPFRQLFICATPPKTHRADISVVRVAANITTSGQGSGGSGSTSSNTSSSSSVNAPSSTSNTSSNSTSSSSAVGVATTSNTSSSSSSPLVGVGGGGVTSGVASPSLPLLLNNTTSSTTSSSSSTSNVNSSNNNSNNSTSIHANNNTVNNNAASHLMSNNIHSTAVSLHLGGTVAGGRQHQNVHKDVIFRSYEDSRTIELLVGDVDGYVSRWQPAKLEQLSQRELQSLCK